MHIENSELRPLTREIVQHICTWVYPPPYEAYSFAGHDDEYLLDESTWGTEQFCLMDGDALLAQVACQMENGDLWVGWSLAPELCGQGSGAEFAAHCTQLLRALHPEAKRILLRVCARNRRAIRAYEKAGFRVIDTIQDEIAYSDHMEDFFVMEYAPRGRNI